MSLDGPLRPAVDSTLHRVIVSADSGHWEEGGLLGSFALWGSELLNALHLLSFRVQDPPCCGMLDIDQSQATERASELLERPSSCPGKSTLSFSESGDL